MIRFELEKRIAIFIEDIISLTFPVIYKPLLGYVLLFVSMCLIVIGLNKKEVASARGIIPLTQ